MIGQRNHDHCPEEHSGTGLIREANEDRAGLLDELFGVMPSASKADKALLSQNFATPESERRTAHSPLLQKRASLRLLEELTLTEYARKVLRHR